MAMLPSDSLLASGGIDPVDRSLAPSHFHGRPDSVVSPLSLPYSVEQSYFDLPRNIEPPPVHHNFPSGHPAASSPQYLSPNHHSTWASARGVSNSAVASPFMASSSGASSPYGNLSPQTIANLLRRREEYSRKLLENWQAERTHLEASRARAEEMFQEERTIMDQERLMWAEQKAMLEDEITDLKKKFQEAETRANDLTKQLGSPRIGGVKFGGAFDGMADGAMENRRSYGSGDSGASGSSRAPLRSPLDGISPNSAPPAKGALAKGDSTIAESNPFIPLDPRMQRASPKNTAASTEQERVPSIDINEVIPGLEGVRLKKPALKKPTFDDGKSPSPTASGKQSPSDPIKALAESHSKVSHAVMTQTALLAPEHRRLTMHAGHTPNHSMSLSQLPTMDCTTDNTAASSGTSTPACIGAPESTEVGLQQILITAPETVQDEAAAKPSNDDNEAMPEQALLDPDDEDPALKGPLCLRNRPVPDEAFLRRLSDKLQEVKDTDAPPSVLNESASSKSGGNTADNHVVDNNAAIDNSEDKLEDVEEDVPLRLKKSTNFGQPLGQIRRTHGS
ncbi:hypothetical protein F4777DRAFT_586367 [Nemania sp. FL0916]|nr:hypothetical protein F4777DRAFT_586367 [Nemania sp. FL0916]